MLGGEPAPEAKQARKAGFVEVEAAAMYGRLHGRGGDSGNFTRGGGVEAYPMIRPWLALLLLAACGHTTSLGAQWAIIEPMVLEKAARCPDDPIEIKRSGAPDVIIATLPPISEYGWLLRLCGQDLPVLLDCSPRGSRTVCLAHRDVPTATSGDGGSVTIANVCTDPTITMLISHASTPTWEEHRCALFAEVANHATVSAAWERLNPTKYLNTVRSAAVEELKHERAVWSLAALLDHSSEDIGITSARALTELGDPRAVGPLIAKARRLAVHQGGSEAATIHGIFQHAVADALNRLTGGDVRLQPGQDSAGLLRGIEIWSSVATLGSPLTTRLDLDPAIAALMAGADAIVRGRAEVAATRDAHIGTIHVEAILRGAVPTNVSFISAPVPYDDEAAIFLLHREADHWRVIDQGKLGIDLVQEPAIRARVGCSSRAVWENAVQAHATDLEVFRRGAGKRWTPSEASAVRAAAAVFADIPWIGIAASEVEAKLGPADEKRVDGSWSYVRHQGEVGVIRLLRFANGRVSVVEVVATQ
jgi:hypothetical protein